MNQPLNVQVGEAAGHLRAQVYQLAGGRRRLVAETAGRQKPEGDEVWVNRRDLFRSKIKKVKC